MWKHGYVPLPPLPFLSFRLPRAPNPSRIASASANSPVRPRPYYPLLASSSPLSSSNLPPFRGFYLAFRVHHFPFFVFRLLAPRQNAKFYGSFIRSKGSYRVPARNRFSRMIYALSAPPWTGEGRTRDSRFYLFLCGLARRVCTYTNTWAFATSPPFSRDATMLTR